MRYFLFFSCLFLTSLRGLAQDVILQTSGEEIRGKVLAITPEHITYVDSARLDTLRLVASTVFLIRYANGTREVLHPASAPARPPALVGVAAYQQGRTDARNQFRAKGAFWGTYGATVVGVGTGGLATGVAAIATGVAIGATKPKTHNLLVSDTRLLENPDYMAGYRKQAQNRKIGSAAGGFGAGLGTVVVVWTAVALVLLSTWH